MQWLVFKLYFRFSIYVFIKIQARKNLDLQISVEPRNNIAFKALNRDELARAGRPAGMS
jgi:hypothetical protein